jgi:hypothetical protein
MQKGSITVISGRANESISDSKSSFLGRSVLCAAILVGSLLTLPAQTSEVRAYRDAALNRDGNAERGKELFFDELRTGCAKCH